jgi:acyl-CoA dehydrogenase
MALDKDTLDELLRTVDRFVDERLRPLEADVAETDRIPDAIIAEMRRLGLFGLSIPQDYGGLGLSMAEEVQVAFRLGRTSPAFRSLIGTNNGIGSQGIVIDGTAEQKHRYLPRLASGEIIGSFCLTEPDAGSDAGSLKTSARRDGNDAFVINGTKRFITNAPEAGVFTVFARTDPASRERAACPLCHRCRTPASRSARMTGRWARRARIPATSCSTMCACRRTASSAGRGARARASRPP